MPCVVLARYAGTAYERKNVKILADHGTQP
jgi:hypothetical protein